MRGWVETVFREGGLRREVERVDCEGGLRGGVERGGWCRVDTIC